MRIALVFFAGIVLFSCTSKSKLEGEVQPLEEKLTLHRFDRELLDADIYDLKNLNKKWLKDYGILYESFLSQMINAGSAQDPMVDYRLEKFLTDSIIQLINGRMKSVFSDFEVHENELNQAFARYHFYYPEETLPVLVPFYSSFNAKTFPYNDTLGIGLDMFLGRNEEVVSLLPPEFFPQYLKQDMDPENLVLEAVKSWVYVKHSRPGEFENFMMYAAREDFLTTLVYHGKMMLLLKALFPEKSEAQLFSFSQKEWEWSEKNEPFIYQNLIEFKLLYSQNIQEINSYINPGSFTPGLPQESPGELGKWIGYKMVAQYFNENELTLQELLIQKNDAKRILSFYRP